MSVTAQVIDPIDCSLYTLPPAELRGIAARMAALDSGGRYSRLRSNGRVWNSAVMKRPDSLMQNADPISADSPKSRSTVAAFAFSMIMARFFFMSATG